MSKESKGDEGGKQRRSRRRRPQMIIGPEDLLDFIELPIFTKRWKQLGLDDEDDLSELQLLSMAGPRDAAVIAGTQGIRKLRFTPPRWNVGKSGATRVLYVHFASFGIVLLCLIYVKGELDDISEHTKKHLSTLVLEIERELRRRFPGR